MIRDPFKTSNEDLNKVKNQLLQGKKNRHFLNNGTSPLKGVFFSKKLLLHGSSIQKVNIG